MGIVADKVRQAPDIKEALVALAEGLDELLAVMAQPQIAPVDPFMAWDNTAEPALAHNDFAEATKPQRDEAAITALKEQLATATGEDRLALEARLRLLEEGGTVVDDAPAEGARPEIVEDGDDLMVNLPVASPEKQAARTLLCEQHQLWEFQTGTVGRLEPAEFTDAFAKGGPAWFYYGDRLGVLSLSGQVRQQLVADVAEDSPALGREMGRDVLMFRDAQDQSNTPALNPLA